MASIIDRLEVLVPRLEAAVARLDGQQIDTSAASAVLQEARAAVSSASASSSSSAPSSSSGSVDLLAAASQFKERLEPLLAKFRSAGEAVGDEPKRMVSLMRCLALRCLSCRVRPCLCP